MELHEITIQPVTGFGTNFKGDTLFGHFCWQTAHDSSLLKTELDNAIDAYEKMPFAVFSSAFPKNRRAPDTLYCFKRPQVPLTWFLEGRNLSKKEKIVESKILKAKNWIKVSPDLVVDLKQENLMSTEQLAPEGFSFTANQPHNAIHRIIGTTGTGRFAPFETQVSWFMPGTQLCIFVLTDPEFIDVGGLVKGMARIGKFGYGRDASTGLGRFEIIENRTLPLPDFSRGNALYTLAPCIPEKEQSKQHFFAPFVRFGKHGDMLAGARQPFKNPVIMADEGAVCIPAGSIDKPYIGRAVTGVSKAMPRTVVQAYAPVLPVLLGGLHENDL